MRLPFGFLKRFDFLLRNPWTRLWLGAPAVVFMAAAIWVSMGYGVVAGVPSSESVLKRSRVEIAANKLDEARIILERHLSERSEDEEVLHQYAAVLVALNQPDRGLAILRKLAPENAVGHIGSQLALCQLALRSPEISYADLKNVESRLNRIMSEHRDHSETKMTLVEMHLRYASNTQNVAERTSHLRSAAQSLNELAAERRPWLGQRLGAIYTLLKDDVSANRWYATASQHYKIQAENNVDDHLSRVAWAQAEYSLKHYEPAFRVLEQGLASALTGVKPFENEKPEDNEKRRLRIVQDYRVLMADVRAAQVEDLKAHNPDNIKERVAKLSEGLDFNPRNQILLQNLVDLSQSQGPQAQEMATKLKELQVKGDNNSALHFVLGVNAFLKNQADQAKFHFERAFEIDPAAPYIANNLAYLVAQSKTPDLKRARSLIDAAIEKQGNNIEFYDTRGMIRIKQGEFKEGSSDLERVNQIKGSTLQRHEMLAMAYDQLGDKETAALHRKEANTIRAEQERQGIRTDIPNSNIIGDSGNLNLEDAKAQDATKAATPPTTPAPTSKPAPSSSPTAKPATAAPKADSKKKAATPAPTGKSAATLNRP